MVSHGGLHVRVQRDPVFSQPNAFGQGTSLQGAIDRVGASESGTGAVALPATTTVEDLAKALTTLGAGPRDLISVLEAMKIAGALDAELEVLE
jgi:flagellar P-ring protein precursor FlgI